jgi:hypothetical protein
MSAFLRKYNTGITAGTAQSIKIPMIKRAVVDFAVGADWTPAAGDVKVSKDGGAAANIATLPAAVAMGNTAYWEFVFSATELSCGTLVVTVADAATKAVEDQSFIIETYGNASAMYAADLSLANLPANVTQLLGTAWLTPGTAGTPDVNTKLINGVATTSVTTINANVGTTQPTNFTGTAGSALVKSDMVDIAGAAVNTASAQIGVSVISYASGQAPLQPTVAGRTLDVSATGEAGLDWANVGTPGSAVNLSATTVNLVNTITTYTGNTVQTGDSFARLGAAGAGLTALGDTRIAHLDADVSSRMATFTLPTNFAALGITVAGKISEVVLCDTVTTNTDMITQANVRTAVGLASANLDTQLAAIAGYIDTEIATLIVSVGSGLNTLVTAVKAKTDNLPASPASTGDVTGVWTTAMAESYNADGSAPTPAQALFVVMQMLTEMSISDTTMTIKKLNGSTTAFTLTLNDATTPTSLTRAT